MVYFTGILTEEQIKMVECADVLNEMCPNIIN
jgi:hypothetical protein